MSLLVIVVVAIVAMLVAWIVSYVDDWSRDWTTNVAETSVVAKDAKLRPLESELSPEELAEVVLSVVGSLPRWSVVDSQERDKERPHEIVLKLVHSTLIVHFQDDVTVTIRGTENGSVLNMRSQSRIGKGDLGQNPRNLRQLLAAVRREMDGKKRKEEGRREV